MARRWSALLAAAFSVLGRLQGPSCWVAGGRPRRLAAPRLGDSKDSGRSTCRQAFREGSNRAAANPYDLLGLPRGAELAAVRPAFRKLAAKLHPDIAGTGDAAAFRKVLWAYQELSDPVRQRRWTRAQRRRRREPAVKVPYYAEVAEDLLDDDDLFQDFEVDHGDTALDDIDELIKQAEQRQARQAAKEWEEELVRVRCLIEGTYTAQGTNHDRPVFRKQQEEDGVDMAIYFWDARNGVDTHGWWIGPQVGGDMVFAFSDTVSSAVPPAASWRIPLSGPIDKSLQLSFSSDSVLQVVFNVKAQR